MHNEADIENRFGFHPAAGEEVIRCADMRYLFQSFALRLDQELPPGREAALAFTKLQEAAMWAQAALAMERPLERDL